MPLNQIIRLLRRTFKNLRRSSVAQYVRAIEHADISDRLQRPDIQIMIREIIRQLSDDPKAQVICEQLSRYA